MSKNIFKNHSKSGPKDKMLSLLRRNKIIFLMEDPFKRQKKELSSRLDIEQGASMR